MTHHRLDRSIRTALGALAAVALLTGRAGATLHGDCDNDSQVAINEVQRCANVYLGTQSVSLCPACDADCSGDTVISEIQGVANCYLNSAAAGCRMITPCTSPTDTPAPTFTMPPLPTDTPTQPPTNTATPQPTDTTTPPLPTDTAAPTPTATPGTAVCGNSQIEAGETCDDGNTLDGDACPSACVINNCSSAGTMMSTNVNVQTPQALRSITVLVDYPDGTVIIPGTGTDATVLARVTNRPGGFTPTIVDLNYALFASLSSGSFSISNNQRIFVVNYDRCQGAPLVTPGDFNCTVREAINASSQDVTASVACSVAVP